jgi:hypothetical protein
MTEWTGRAEKAASEPPKAASAVERLIPSLSTVDSDPRAPFKRRADARSNAVPRRPVTAPSCP